MLARNPPSLRVLQPLPGDELGWWKGPPDGRHTGTLRGPGLGAGSPGGQEEEGSPALGIPQHPPHPGQLPPHLEPGRQVGRPGHSGFRGRGPLSGGRVGRQCLGGVGVVP